MKQFTKYTIISFSFVLSIAQLATLANPVKVNAVTASDWDASRIIDDAVFFNPHRMSSQDIQNFLNSKVPTCDTNGEKMYNSTQTRAQWAAANNKPQPPYTCLKDYSQNIPGINPDSYCSGSVGAGTKSAATIIKEVALACGINPQVILVTLQKEQSLITDDWPWPVQYTKATGMGCPDTSLGIDVDANQNGCYDEYEGFFKQVYYGARQFQRYVKQPDVFNYAKGRNSFVAYQANSPGCGGTHITPQSHATAALYNYTPYQPNAAALNNLYGTGDACSAYGNRNFWRMYSDWFGSTLTNIPYAWNFESLDVYLDSARTIRFNPSTAVAPETLFYVTVRGRNTGYQIWDPTFLRLGTWSATDRQSAFYDPSWTNVVRPTALQEATISPGQIGTFNFTLKAPPTTGTYREFFNLVAEGKTWLNDISLHLNIDVVEPGVPTNSTNTTLSPGQIMRPGQLLLSPDRLTTLALQQDGNLVLYSSFLPFWNTATSGKRVDRLEMQTDGNLVFYDHLNQPLWNTQTPGNPGAYTTLQADGNLVVYSASGTPLWASYTLTQPDNLSRVAHTLANSILYQGQQLETADRKYRLILQEDGNLVLYSTASERALWATYTVGANRPFLIMQPDGHLVLYDTSGKALWFSQTYNQGPSKLVIQGDGNLVIYNGSNRPTWHTATQGMQ